LPGLCTGGEYYAGLVYQRYFAFCGAKVLLFPETAKLSATFLHSGNVIPLIETGQFKK
jgi:hypothetical protein